MRVVPLLVALMLGVPALEGRRLFLTVRRSVVELGLPAVHPLMLGIAFRCVRVCGLSRA